MTGTPVFKDFFMLLRTSFCAVGMALDCADELSASALTAEPALSEDAADALSELPSEITAALLCSGFTLLSPWELSLWDEAEPLPHPAASIRADETKIVTMRFVFVNYCLPDVAAHRAVTDARFNVSLS